MAASSSLCEGLRAKAPLDKPKIIPFDEEKAPWRSAVAVILRISATGQTEVLMMRRTEQKNDPFSGDVCLPGGRQDPEDGVQGKEATDKVTAVREAMEEVGLDVENAQDFEYLGRLSDTRVSKRMIMCAFVFLLKPGRETPPLKLQEAEVQCAWWLSLEVLVQIEMTKLRKHYSRFIRKGPTVSLFGRSMAFLCMCDQVYFRSYLLPLPAGVDEKEQEKFVLWGFTLDVLSELIEHARGTNLVGMWPDGTPVVSAWDFWYTNDLYRIATGKKPRPKKRLRYQPKNKVVPLG
mmetsp:Transcript_27186/g.63545  ORF Transcript_27186/g.63545 Transcript_27186/m.63545 type:complete len:291 (+) Transcript_27186:114-986(+)